MPTYSADYSGDWAHVDGVETATWTSQDGGTSVATVKVKRGSLSILDFQGGTFSVQPGDVPFIVWDGSLDSNELELHSTLTIGGTVYTIIGISTRGDVSQHRVITRKQS